VSDARLMAETLRDRGFEVIEVIDANQREMRLAMVTFGDLLRRGGVGLFYYAGHGIQVGGENYLIPIDAIIDREEHVAIEGVNVNQVLARMDGARNRLNIVILDSCRNNPFARSFRSVSSGLAQMLAPSGTYIAYATAPGDVAVDGRGVNSPFSAALAQRVAMPGQPLEEVFKRVRLDVQQLTGGRQVPWTSSSITGDFYFTPQGTEVARATPPATERASRTETVFWTSIADSDIANDFEAYLEQYPDGAFAPLARLRIDRLRGSAEEERTATPPRETVQELLAPTEPLALRNDRSAVAALDVDRWDGTYRCQPSREGKRKFCPGIRGSITVENGVLRGQVEHRGGREGLTNIYYLSARIDSTGAIVESEPVRGHMNFPDPIQGALLSGTLWDTVVEGVHLRFIDPPMATD
jgi:hypothetical protein